MQLHANAKTTPKARALLVQRVMTPAWTYQAGRERPASAFAPWRSGSSAREPKARPGCAIASVGHPKSAISGPLKTGHFE